LKVRRNRDLDRSPVSYGLSSRGQINMVDFGGGAMAQKSATPVRVLGVDPGTRRLGYGVVEMRGNRMTPIAFGVIDVTSDQDFLVRLVRLCDEIKSVIAEHKPTVAAIEQVFAGRNVKTAIRSAEGRGAILTTLAQQGLPVTEYATRSVKQAVTGRGNAAKSQVGMMIQTLLSLKTVPAEDAGDALAVAVCHLQRAGMPSASRSSSSSGVMHSVVPDPREVLANMMSSRKSSRAKAAAKPTRSKPTGSKSSRPAAPVRVTRPKQAAARSK